MMFKLYKIVVNFNPARAVPVSRLMFVGTHYGPAEAVGMAMNTLHAHNQSAENITSVSVMRVKKDQVLMPFNQKAVPNMYDFDLDEDAADWKARIGGTD